MQLCLLAIVTSSSMQVRARFVERFSMGAPFSGGEVHGRAFSDMSEKVSWVEKFVQLGTQASQQAAAEDDWWALCFC